MLKFWNKNGTSKDSKSIILVLIEAYSADVGGKIARIYKGDMKDVGIKEGDIVKIDGKTVTVAICKKLGDNDDGRGIIRLDVNQRANLGEIYEKVTVQKINTENADSVVFLPLTDMPLVDERYFVERFVGMPFTKGEIFEIHVNFQDYPIMVHAVYPDSVVVCTDQTKYQLLDYDG